MRYICTKRIQIESPVTYNFNSENVLNAKMKKASFRLISSMECGPERKRTRARKNNYHRNVRLYLDWYRAWYMCVGFARQPRDSKMCVCI